jgi:hypothetical protein
MPRLRSIIVLLGASTVLCAGTFAEQGDAGTRQRCANLKGKRLVSDRSVKVVERGNESKAFVFACVPPNGRVRLAGSAYDATVTGSYSVRIAASAGTWVVLDASNTIDFHGSEEVEKAFDARSGASYRVYEASNPEGPGFEEIPSDSASLERLLLNRFGQLALVLSEGGNSQIVGVEPNGRRRVLDSAPSAQLPSAALKLEGHTVEWIKAGSARSATL